MSEVVTIGFDSKPRPTIEMETAEGTIFKVDIQAGKIRFAVSRKNTKIPVDLTKHQSNRLKWLLEQHFLPRIE